mmetsp:Transcript_29957/g.45413  ORF Transcript_29957/g.45413 Transcript_29957/m.45413 type:complete len:313 (-) Transcript_29957:175-1113(-)
MDTRAKRAAAAVLRESGATMKEAQIQTEHADRNNTTTKKRKRIRRNVRKAIRRVKTSIQRSLFRKKNPPMLYTSDGESLLSSCIARPTPSESLLQPKKKKKKNQSLRLSSAATTVSTPPKESNPQHTNSPIRLLRGTPREPTQPPKESLGGLLRSRRRSTLTQANLPNNISTTKVNPYFDNNKSNHTDDDAEEEPGISIPGIVAWHEQDDDDVSQITKDNYFRHAEQQDQKERRERRKNSKVKVLHAYEYQSASPSHFSPPPTSVVVYPNATMMLTTTIFSVLLAVVWVHCMDVTWLRKMMVQWILSTRRSR